MIIEKPSRTYAWFHDVTTRDIEVNRGEGVGAHNVLAGSPIDENGNVANDETAIGLLMETVSDANPNGKIVVAGDVDALGAKNASGIELSDAAKGALSGITWREPDYVVEMQAGGGWPSDLPKPSVGGYGYTEQGEQTVITWDGDTEGRDVFDNAYYKITDDAPQISTNFKKFIFNGVEHEITEENIEAGADHLIFIIVNDIIYVVIADEDVDLGGVSVTKGVYFVKAPVGGYVSSLTYGTPDTVHKIDEKYLPASGGAMVVNFSVGAGGYTADKTPQEIVSAFSSGTFVYAVLMGLQTATLTMAEDYGEGEYNVQFDSVGVVPETGVIVLHIEWSYDDSAWTHYQKVIPLN